MTYPPQQPDPYGQQPGSYGQQPGGAFPPDGPQQQHGCHSETQQYGQPGQHGQSWGQRGQQNSFGADPGGTQQFPQSDPYGQQQDPYGQKQTSYDPYGQQSGFSDGEPPRRKTGLIVGIAIAAVVVVGGVVALIGGITQTGQTAKMPIKATLNGQTDFGFVGFKQESGLWCFTGATQS
jgi:hypothetical protein